jgi:hypothetical protein
MAFLAVCFKVLLDMRTHKVEDVFVGGRAVVIGHSSSLITKGLLVRQQLLIKKMQYKEYATRKEGGTQLILVKLVLTHRIAASILLLWRNDEDYELRRARFPPRHAEGL